jgi:hypothetical protein
VKPKCCLISGQNSEDEADNNWSDTMTTSCVDFGTGFRDAEDLDSRTSRSETYPFETPVCGSLVQEAAILCFSVHP